MNVRFKSNSDYSITHYLRVLRKYGEVTTLLKRKQTDPDVIVALQGDVLSKLFEIMDEIGRTIEMSENTGADAEEVPLIAEIMTEQ
ncbi:hypothetical protein [Paenibacillus thermotolerans]|uniref:hypothetical protein n=1 Tax=Paenibacillus thermotolerans TaxID=3027807 RepID=UPI002368365A|nr:MULTISPECIES: hypothetical protein [unclassified Paenibacillus]